MLTPYRLYCSKNNVCLEHILSVRSTFTWSSVGMDFLHLYLCPQEEPFEIKGLQCCSKTVNEQSCKHFSPPKWRHLADAPFLEAARPWSCSWTGGVKLQILSITQQCKSIWGPVCIASALWYNHIPELLFFMIPSQNKKKHHSCNVFQGAGGRECV